VARKVEVDELVGVTEIAERSGLSSPRRVHEWRGRYPDFPEPVARLAAGHVFAWPDVEKWAKATGRPIVRA
jgi:hypothetical protein